MQVFFLLQKHFENINIFSLKAVKMCNVENKNNNTNRKKVSSNNSITPKITKKPSTASASILYRIFNASIKKKLYVLFAPSKTFK